MDAEIGVIPVKRNQEQTFKGEEYLDLYPYVDVAIVENSQERRLWINKSEKFYGSLYHWVKGTGMMREHD
jgi:hypothetical protein